MGIILFTSCSPGRQALSSSLPPISGHFSDWDEQSQKSKVKSKNSPLQRPF